MIILSGGQSGADLAGWRAAKRFGISTSGWMDSGWTTEDGPRPEYGLIYGAKAMPPGSALLVQAVRYRRRAEANVRDSDATICFYLEESRAVANVEDDRKKYRKEAKFVRLERRNGVLTSIFAPDHVAMWVRDHRIDALNVAGNRESKCPGIGAYVEGFLADVFRILGYEELHG